jgi:WD40 repeat protein
LTMSCAFSPDGRWLFMGNNDEESTVWDLRNRRIAAKLQVPAIAAVFSPDASMLVCISMFCGVLVAYEVGSWTGRRGPRIGDSADAVAFSADGELVAMTKMRGALSVKHLQSGATLLVPEDLSEGVVSSMFSPTDSRLLTVDRDGVARIWDTDLLERTTERPPLPGPPQLAASDEDDEEITEEMLPANGI